jgi:hypothetical protein
MLRFKGSYSYGTEIEKYGRIKRDVMDQLCRDIFTGYVCRDLPAELEKQGIETTSEQCRNQSAVIVGHYADEFEQECLKFAQEASDGRDPKVVISDLDEFYLGLIRKMDAELENEFGQYSDRYHNSLEDFTTQCMSHLPSKTIPSNCDHRNWKLNRLLTYENFLEHWQDVFGNDDWSEAAILREIDGGLSKALVYDALRKSDGDLDLAAKIAASVVYEDFFVDVLANELRTVAINRVEPSDDLETLLGTVNDLVTGEFFELADSIEQLVKDLAEQMRHELDSELM